MVAFALVLAVSVSLWFAAPARALTISFPSLPASGTLGSTYSFTVQVDIQDNELLPVQNINLYIYKADDRATYEATLASLPLNTGSKSYTGAQMGVPSGSASVTATSDSNWGYSYGTGYVRFHNKGYSFTPSSSYGYGYSSGTGTTSITYAVTWASPSSWSASTYRIEAKITAPDNQTFIQTSSAFSLSAPAAAAAPPAPTSGVTDLSGKVGGRGVFLTDVTVQSDDGNVSLSIDEGIHGVTEEGIPLTEISVLEMAAPPAPPADTNVIGLVYDFGPEGATFDQPIIITLTYDPAQIPEGVAEEDLVIAWWDKEAGEWVELLSVVNPVTNTITAEISHFTPFTILAAVPAPAPPAPAPAPAPPTPAPPAPVVPPITPVNWWLIGGIIAAVIIIGVVAWQVVARRRT